MSKREHKTVQKEKEECNLLIQPKEDSKLTDREYKTMKYREAVEDIILLANQLYETGKFINNRNEISVEVKETTWGNLLKALNTVEQLHSRMADIYYADEES